MVASSSSIASSPAKISPNLVRNYLPRCQRECRSTTVTVCLGGAYYRTAHNPGHPGDSRETLVSFAWGDCLWALWHPGLL